MSHAPSPRLPLARSWTAAVLLIASSACAPSRSSRAGAAPPDDSSPSFEPSSVTVRGDWTAHQQAEPYRHIVHFVTSHRPTGGDDTLVTSSPERIPELVGVTRAQIEGPDTEVRFAMERDAGTATFAGRFAAGQGAGTFEFAPNLAFFREVQTQEERTLVDDEKMYAFARHDLSRSFVRQMRSMGYADLSLDDLLELRWYRTTPAMIREWSALGYPPLSKSQLVRLLEHLVHPSDARALAAAGYAHLPLEDLVALKTNGVTPDFIRRVNGNGQPASVEQLLRAKSEPR